MDTTILLNILKPLLSSNENERVHAEHQIKELSQNHTDFALILAQIAVSQNFALEERQLAGVTLRIFVSTSWVNEEYCSVHTKAAVRDIILQGLSDSNQQMRNIFAYVIAKVAEEDFPTRWPGLLDYLIRSLQSDSVDTIDGVLKSLSELLKSASDLSNQEIKRLLIEVMPMLFTILQHNKRIDNNHQITSSYITSTQILSIFTDFFLVLISSFNSNDSCLNDVQQQVVAFANQCLQEIIYIINAFTSDDQGFELKIQCVECIYSLLKAEIDPVNKMLHQVYSCILTDLQNLMWQLETAILSKNNLICKHLTVMSDLCLESTVKDYLMQGSQATEPFKTLVFILFYCMKIVDMDGRNNANLHQLIEKMLEPAEAQSLVIRNCAKNTCRLLVQFYGASMMPLIQATVHSFITESESYRQSDPERWWKTREACLYGVSNIPKDIFMDNPECFDLQGFLKGVVSSDITEYDYPILQGRAFMTVTHFIEQFSLEDVNQCAHIITSGLKSNSSIVQMAALVALYHLKVCRTYYDCIIPYQTTILEFACSLVNITMDDSLVFILDILNFAVDISPQNAVEYEHTLIPTYLQVWYKLQQSGTGSSQVMIQQALEELAANPLFYVPLCQRAFPILQEIINKQANNNDICKAALEFLLILMDYSGTPLLVNFVDELFPSVCNFACNVQDKEVHMTIQKCMKIFIIKDSEHLTHWRDKHNKSGLEHIVEYVVRLLNNPISNEDELQPQEDILIGHLMLALIEKTVDIISPVLPNLLYGILMRLEGTSSQFAQQSYIMLFAHLVIYKQKPVLDFLETKVGEEKNGFEILIPLWLENSESFTGQYSSKVSNIALSMMLFASMDYPTLQTMQIRGEVLIEASPIGVRTRSQAKRQPNQYKAVSVQTKITKLLVDELSNILTNEGQIVNPDEYEEEEEDDEDDDDDKEFDSLIETTPLQTNAIFLNNCLDNGEVSDSIKNIDQKAYLIQFFKKAMKNEFFSNQLLQDLNTGEQLALDFALCH